MGRYWPWCEAGGERRVSKRKRIRRDGEIIFTGQPAPTLKAGKSVQLTLAPANTLFGRPDMTTYHQTASVEDIRAFVRACDDRLAPDVPVTIHEGYLTASRTEVLL